MKMKLSLVVYEVLFDPKDNKGMITKPKQHVTDPKSTMKMRIIS